MYKSVNDRRLKSAEFSEGLHIRRIYHITVSFSPSEYMLETSEGPVTL